MPKLIYLDHNATTKMEQAALDALLLFSSGDPQYFGNSSSIHWAGRRAKLAVEEAREAVAAAFGIFHPEEILFTSSATEAINTALKGAFFAKEKEKFHLITTSVEHEATLECAHFLERLGAQCTILPVTAEGELELGALEEALKASADAFTLLSLMVGNNETGVVFPFREAVRLGKQYGALVHLDAVQGPGKISGFSLQDLPVDMASFSAHKIGGPKGVGALYVRRGTKLVSLMHGGAQERKRRAGTGNVAGIAAFGAAAKLLSNRDLARVKNLRDDLENKVRDQISGVKVNGGSAKERMVNTSNLLFEGVRGEALLMGLDLEGFAVSSGSACNSGSILPSHVLLAMGLDKSAAASACRVSLSPDNTAEEMELFVAALAKVVARIRSQPKAPGLHPMKKSTPFAAPLEQQ